jgi:hypothetical protein
MVGSMAKLRGNPWAVLVVVSLGFFMTLLDKTIPDAKTFDQRHRRHDVREPWCPLSEEKL